MAVSKTFVYVQAIPESIPSRAKNFGDLKESTAFRMAHSSKIALERAKQSSSKIIALGHSSVLREALARGANEIIVLPLCDDPLVQAQGIKDQLSEDVQSSVFVVGENLDGPFSGSALCGALSALFDLGLEFDLGSEKHLAAKNGSVVLVKDDGTRASNIDIRRIDFAQSREIPESQVTGTSSLERRETARTPETIKDQSTREIASTISRRLHRIAC